MTTNRQVLYRGLSSQEDCDECMNRMIANMFRVSRQLTVAAQEAQEAFIKFGNAMNTITTETGININQSSIGYEVKEKKVLVDKRPYFRQFNGKY